MEENDNEKKKNFTLKDWIDTKNNLKKSFKYVKNNKKNLIMGAIIALLEVPISILNPILTSKIVLNLNENMYENVLRIAFFMIITYCISHILTYLASIVNKRYYTYVTYDVKKELMNETFNIKTSCFDEVGTGLFTNRLENDTSNIAYVFDTLTSTIVQILSNIGIFVVIFSINKIMFLFFVILGIKDIIIMKKRTREYYDGYAKLRKLEEKNTGLLSELIRGVRDIKVLNANDIFMKKFDERINEVNEKRMNINVKSSRFYLLNNILTEIFNFMFYLLGIVLVKNNLLLASNFLVLYMYKSNVRNILFYVESMIDYLKSFNLSANRVFEIIDGKKYPKEKFGNINLKKIKGDFEFKNVTFSYKKDKEILHNVSFKVKANTTVAFVGKSGSGKTTLFSLLTKLYDVEDNKIFIDNHDINTLSKNSLRNNMSIITQNPYIFNLSIRDNLLLVKDKVTESDMIKACKIAQIHDYIMSLPNGYDTIVGEGGVTLSGGERQRLAIARALIKKTEIILFDEATSALDNETQEKIQNAIHSLKGKYTILIIAHRLSTIINSDNIFMLEDGKIVGSGTHKELIKKSKKYQNLYHASLVK